MPSEKNKYRCYYTAYVNNFGEVTLNRNFLGETYAESEKKAVANMKYRLKKQYSRGVNDLNIIATLVQ